MENEHAAMNRRARFPTYAGVAGFKCRHRRAATTDADCGSDVERERPTLRPAGEVAARATTYANRPGNFDALIA